MRGLEETRKLITALGHALVEFEIEFEAFAHLTTVQPTPARRLALAAAREVIQRHAEPACAVVLAFDDGATLDSDLRARLSVARDVIDRTAEGLKRHRAEARA